MEGKQTPGTVFTNVQLPPAGDPNCTECSGKGYVGARDHSANSVTPCQACCKHERGTTKLDKNCRNCGKDLSKN